MYFSPLRTTVQRLSSDVKSKISEPTCFGRINPNFRNVDGSDGVGELPPRGVVLFKPSLDRCPAEQTYHLDKTSCCWLLWIVWLQTTFYDPHQE